MDPVRETGSFPFFFITVRPVRLRDPVFHIFLNDPVPEAVPAWHF